MRSYLYHASPLEHLDSILTCGLRAGADGCVHLAANPTLALYGVFLCDHLYRRDARIALFRVDQATICVQPDAAAALFATAWYVHTGDIAQAKVAFVLTTQVGRGLPLRDPTLDLEARV